MSDLSVGLQADPAIAGAPEEQPAPAPVDHTGQVLLRLTEHWRTGGFNSGVDGVDPITLSGTWVPEDQVSAVLQQAQWSKVGIGEE